MLEKQLEQDLKSAMLASDKVKVATLRSLKSALIYVKVGSGTRDKAMPDDEVVAVLAKEAKKRQESADLYAKGGDSERSVAELEEKRIIENYLPAQLTEEEIRLLVLDAMSGQSFDKSSMGQLIGKVKSSAKGSADGALIAKVVKEEINKQ